MRATVCAIVIGASFLQTQAPATSPAAPAGDPIKTIVGRLDLEKYKATIKGLTQFGDRRQGTERNREARRLDRSAAQELRLHEHRAHHLYVHAARAAQRGRGARRGGAGAAHGAAAPGAQARGGGNGDAAQGGRQPIRGVRARTGVNTDLAAPARRAAARTRYRADAEGPASGRKCTARRSARRTPKRCTSSAATWTASAGAKRRTTTARARRS